MTFYYSMKQMLRSPLKSFLFFLLMGVAAFFLALGGNLFYMSQTAIQEFEDIFTTIGTVEQTPNDVEKVGEMWDAELKEYQYSKYKTYGERISEDVLDFEGAGYALKPRQRPYFGAYIDELYEGVGRDWLITVEVTPVETAVADHSIKMKVIKVLEGYINEGDIIYICEHQNPEPSLFEAGKNYVMQLNKMTFVHGTEEENKEMGERPFEYWPSGSGIQSTQYTLDGEQIEDPVNGDSWFDEVTDGFYETERGKRWILAGKTQDAQVHTVPVQPTDGTKLLMPFYKNEVVITEGRDITEEEYKKGKKVCLIPNTLAIQTRTSVGDKLTLPLYFAAYGITPGQNFGLAGGYLNAKGEPYPVFNEQKYEIVGIYTMKEDKGQGPYHIGKYETVIPWNAVPENCWKDNIVYFSRMIGADTSFELPNGTIHEYQKLWEKQGVDHIKITYYDKGYTQLKEGVDNRRIMSWIFLIGGGILAVMILLFFSNLFITGQQERLAVERLLGKTRKQCTASILTGLLILAAAGCIMGSVAGYKATGVAAKNADTAETFDTTFSNTVIDSSDKEDVEWAKPSMTLAFATGGGLLLAAFVISSCYMKENLKKEPLMLLGKIEE